MREMLPIDKVMVLAKAGETFTLEAGACSLNDLVAVATTVGQSNATVWFRGLNDRPIEDLMRITVASHGRVILERRHEAPIYKPRAGWLKRFGASARRDQQVPGETSPRLQHA